MHCACIHSKRFFIVVERNENARVINKQKDASRFIVCAQTRQRRLGCWSKRAMSSNDIKYKDGCTRKKCLLWNDRCSLVSSLHVGPNIPSTITDSFVMEERLGRDSDDCLRVFTLLRGPGQDQNITPFTLLDDESRRPAFCQRR